MENLVWIVARFLRHFTPIFIAIYLQERMILGPEMGFFSGIWEIAVASLVLSIISIILVEL